MYIGGKKVTIWSSNFTYGIGLIVSDGNLSLDGRHIMFKSAELEMIEKFQKSFGVKNKIGKSARGGEKIKKYFYTQFSDVKFYKFLNGLGITSAKSKTIKSIKIPDRAFHDFLRGLFDGDGTFYSYWDKRWPNSFVFQMSFASASFEFISWLKDKLTKLYKVRGFICKGDGVFNLRYVKNDSKKLYEFMYYKNNLLFLNRKYFKIKYALDKDKRLH